MTDYAPNTLVTLSDGRTMTWTQYQQVVTQEVAVFAQQMSASIEQMSALASQMSSGSEAVRSALAGLKADMTGIEYACGDPQNLDNRIGNTMGSSLPKALDNLYRAIENICPNVEQVGQGCKDGADTLFQAEESTLQGFSKRGFNFTAVDPRQADRVLNRGGGGRDGRR
jgi:uncharacterized protein YukE